MPIRHGAPLGAPSWIDLTTSDLDRARDFYGTVFGWTFESAGPEYGGYVNAAKDGHPVAGLMANNPQWLSPDTWTIYFHTADVNATAAKVRAAGGCCLDPMEVPAKGFMSLASDPTGAMFGLWQPLEHRGFEVIGEAGSPVWHQLTTHDHRAAVDFYRDVLGGGPKTFLTPTNSATPQRVSVTSNCSASWTAPVASPTACRRTGPPSSAPTTSTRHCS